MGNCCSGPTSGNTFPSFNNPPAQSNPPMKRCVPIRKLASTRRLKDCLALEWGDEPDFERLFIPQLMSYLLGLDLLNEGLQQDVYDFKVAYTELPDVRSYVEIWILGQEYKPVHKVAAGFNEGMHTNPSRHEWRLEAYVAMLHRVMGLLNKTRTTQEKGSRRLASQENPLVTSTEENAEDLPPAYSATETQK